MILCGTSPNANWRGTLAVLALGLFAVPLLPALTSAQTKEPTPEGPGLRAVIRLQGDKETDAAKVQAQLEKARAEMARLQAEIQLLQQRLKAMEAAKGEKPGKPVTGIIMLDGLNLNFEPEAKKPIEVIIILRKVGDKWEVVPQPAKQPAKQPEGQAFRIEGKEGGWQLVPLEGAPGGKMLFKVVPEGRPGQGLPPMNKPTPTPAPKPASDQRLDNLERQLRDILKELESLRKEGKPQKPGATSAPQGFELRFDDLQVTPKPEKK